MCVSGRMCRGKESRWRWCYCCCEGQFVVVVAMLAQVNSRRQSATGMANISRPKGIIGARGGSRKQHFSHQSSAHIVGGVAHFGQCFGTDTLVSLHY